MRTGGLRILILATVLAGLTGCGTLGTDRAGGIELASGPLPGKFVWHDLMTDDLPAARRFYGELFGWSFEDTTHPRGGDYTLIVADGRYLGGMVQLDDPPGADYSRWLGYLSVPDVDEAVAAAASGGGGAVVGPLDLPNIGRAAAIRDPQGAVVGLLRSRIGDPLDGASSARGEVVWNELLTADEAAAAAFYAQISGAEARAEQRENGPYWYLRAQQLDRAGVLRRPLDEVQPFWLTHFAVADASLAAEQAARLGGTVLLAPDAGLRGGTLAIVTDPAGAILALRQWSDQERRQP
jgi:predicted enzyme related to lactoylglutathione lyase